MYWHAETTLNLEIQIAPGRWFRMRKVTLRGYAESDGYDRHQPFLAVGQADLFTDEAKAFVHATLTRGGGLNREAWTELGIFLRDQHGMDAIVMDRHGTTIDRVLTRLVTRRCEGA